MRTVRIFISSPSDVMHERQRVHRVIERLNGEYATVARFEAVRWETRFYGAHASFQDAIPEARDCDVVIGILWSRLGTALPETFPAMPPEFAQTPDERYPSGTAYELLSSTFARKARAAAGQAGKPDVYVFRKSAPAVIKLGNPEELTEAQEQWNRLEAFFDRWFRGPGGAIRAAFHTFDATDEFERATEALLRAWIKDNLEGAAAVVWPATMGSPFRGLAQFDAAHAPVFFGRDRKVGRAIELLKDAAAAAAAAGVPAEPGKRDRLARPFLLIVGPSGSGKSSLMRAGLAPRLTAPGVVPAVDLWRTAVMRPADASSAFEALAEALVRDGTTGDHGGFGAALPELAATPGVTANLARLLADDPAEASSRVIAALDAAGESERRRESYERRLTANLLLLVDQLEDIFSSDISDDPRARFAQALSTLAATGRVWVVATLRGDLYERLISDRPWIALKDSGATYDLAPPGPEELEEIVRKSAAAAGLQYETDSATGKRLDEQVLADASGQDILPLLQFTLNRLYDEREAADGITWLTYRAYRALGGLDGAIDQAAEQALTGLATEAIEALPRLLRLLAVPVDNRAQTAAGGRAALTVRAVRSAAVKRDAASAKLADALVGARILLASRDENDEGPLLSVAHQRVFQSWRRAQAIIADQQDFYRIRDDVEKQHQRWTGGGQSRQLLIPPGVAIAEAEKVAGSYRDELPDPLLTFIGVSGRRARWRQRALLAATVIFAIVAAVAAWQRNVATKAQMSAEANYLTARGTIDGIIKSFAGRLSQMQGVPIETVETAFKEISRSVDDLGARAATSDPTFDKTRADLAYEFARTYKKAESPRAMQLAENGLRLLERLADRYPKNADYRLAMSNSHELISDLMRTSAPKQAWQAAEKALALRRALNEAEPGNPVWAESLAKSLVRAGDLEAQVNRNFAAASERYYEALDLSLQWILRREDDPAWQRELSWALNKIGDQKSRGAASAQSEALAHFEQELCLRRRLYESDHSNTLFQSDVSWSLERVGRARQRLGDLAAAAEAFVESIGLRRALLDNDRNNEVWLRDLYVIVTRYGDLQLESRNADAAFVYLSEAQRLHQALADRNALQNWLPQFAPGLEKARGLLGDEADRLLSALDAAVKQKENISVRQFLVKRPTSAECWPKLTGDLAALAAARGLAPAGSP